MQDSPIFGVNSISEIPIMFGEVVPFMQREVVIGGTEEDLLPLKDISDSMHLVVQEFMEHPQQFNHPHKLYITVSNINKKNGNFKSNI